MIRRLTSLGIIALLALLVAAACGGEDPTPTSVPPTATPTTAVSTGSAATPTPANTPTPESGGVFKFGFNEALQVAWGLSELRSFLIVADKYNNERGGLLVDGKLYKIEIPYYDNEYKGDIAVSNAKKLIFEDGVKFMYVGGSGPALAVAPTLRANNVLWNAGAYASVIGPENPLAFRTMRTGNELDLAINLWVKENLPDVNKLAHLTVNDDAGFKVNEQLKYFSDQVGFEVVSDFVERGLKDFYPQLTRLLGKNPDMFFFTGGDRNDVYLQIKQVRELGWTGPILMTKPVAEDLIAIVGFDGAQGVYGEGLAPGTAEKELVPFALEIEEQYREIYGTDPYSPYEIDMLWTILQAIEKADSFDVNEVRLALETEEFDTVFGKARFRGGLTYGLNHQLISPVFMMQLQGDSMVQLAKLVLGE